MASGALCYVGSFGNSGFPNLRLAIENQDKKNLEGEVRVRITTSSRELIGSLQFKKKWLRGERHHGTYLNFLLSTKFIDKVFIGPVCIFALTPLLDAVKVHWL